MKEEEITKKYNELMEGTDKHIVTMLFRVNQSIDKLEKSTSRYSKILIGLTIVLAILTIIQLATFLR